MRAFYKIDTQDVSDTKRETYYARLSVKFYFLEVRIIKDNLS